MNSDTSAATELYIGKSGFSYIDEVFGNAGIFAGILEDRYESRPGQIEMAKAVDAAIRSEEHLLVEAPTGTGKSLGYGVPAVFHAANSQRVVVVVTANIALQEQLVAKDLPLLCDCLPWKFSFALLKGRGNYLCLKRFYHEKSDLLLNIGASEVPHLKAILTWAEETETGDVSELDFQPAQETWRRFSSSSEECVGKACRYRRECFAQAARSEALAADIIVANYSLFFAHLNIKEETERDLLLPPFDVAILDEAHRAAELARNFFGFRVTFGAVRHAGRFLKKLGFLDKYELLKTTSELFFNDLARYRKSDTYGSRIRFQYQIPCKGLCDLLVDTSKTYIEKANTLKDEDLAADVRKAGERCRKLATLIWKAILLTDPKSVSFIEEDRKGQGILCSKPVEVADRLRAVLFDETPSVILTSATLTTKNSFKYVCNEVGVPSPRLLTVESPFDMRRQALWVLPKMPGPNTDGFTDAVGARFLDIIDHARGRTLGLFTSYKNLNATYECLRFCEYRILKQGDLPRSQLIAEFKQDVDSVLLGTESFWAGVDVPGEALSCVVIDRLPFPTPGDPVLDAIKESDPQCFQNHFLPRAVIAFKQGVGRLIRRTTFAGDAQDQRPGGHSPFSRGGAVMEVFVNGTICFAVESVHPKLLERLRLDFSFANPEYVKRKRLGRRTGGIPSRIECLTEDEHGIVEIPRGGVALFRQRCAEHGVPVSFESRRVLFPRQGFRADLKLRYYQEAAIRTLRAGVQGYVVAPCGAGKSILAAGLIAALDQPTLILVHTRQLLDQWRTLIERIFGFEPGVVSGGRFEIAPITVGTIQTLRQKGLPFISHRFGCVIADECHHAPCSMFQAVLPELPAHYRFGLTATPYREDGMTQLIEWTFGRKLFEIAHEELLDRQHLIKPQVGVLYSDFCFEFDKDIEKYDHARCIDLLVNDEERNKLIAILAYAEAQTGHTVLVLSSRVDHCHRLAEMVRKRDIDTEVLVGAMGKTKRRRILDDFKKGAVPVVVATTLADEGMDVPRLDRVILAFPGRGKGRTQQRLGRLMRPHASKRVAVLYDIVDAQVPALWRQYLARKRLYRSLGIEPVESPIFGNQEGSHGND